MSPTDLESHDESRVKLLVSKVTWTTPSLFLVFFPIPYPPVLSFYDSVIPCSSEILIFLFFVHLFQMVVGSTMFFILFLHLHIIILGPASFWKATHILLSLQTLDVQLALLLLRILITMLVTSTPPSPPPLFFRSYGTELCSFKHSPYLVCATSLAGCLLPFLFLHRPPTLTSFTHTFSLLLPSNLFSWLFARFLMSTLFNLFLLLKTPLLYPLNTSYSFPLLSGTSWPSTSHLFPVLQLPSSRYLQSSTLPLAMIFPGYLPPHRLHLEKLSYSTSAPSYRTTSHYWFKHANWRPPLFQSATFLLRRWWLDLRQITTPSTLFSEQSLPLQPHPFFLDSASIFRHSHLQIQSSLPFLPVSRVST